MILPVQAELEYPAGKVLLDGSNWLSDPKISPDGKWVAFSDHQNAEGDDRWNGGRDWTRWKGEDSLKRLELHRGRLMVAGWG